MDPKIKIQMASDLHTISAPGRFIGSIIGNMVLFALFVLLFPVLIMLAICEAKNPQSISFFKFIFGVFGPFAISIWCLVIHGLLNDDLREEDRWGKHGGIPLGFVFIISSYAGEFLAAIINYDNRLTGRENLIVFFFGLLFIPVLITVCRARQIFTMDCTAYYLEGERKREELSKQWDEIDDWETARKPDDLWEKEHHPKHFALQQKTKKEAQERCDERWRKKNPTAEEFVEADWLRSVKR